MKAALAVAALWALVGTCSATAFPTNPTGFQFPTTNYQSAISFTFGAQNIDYQKQSGQIPLHVGEDISPSNTGMSVYAAGTGTVVLARLWPSCASGNWGYILVMEHVLIDGSNATTIYGHLDPSSVRVKEGQVVSIGTLLGKTGNYAKDGVLGSPSPCPNWPEHLHFGVHLGPYGSAIGVYAPWLHGYLLPAVFPDDYVKPSEFILANSSRNTTIGAPPNTSNCLPFGCNPLDVYQQVYAGSQFPGPMTITDISFFVASCPTPPCTISSATYTISLSTTQKAVNGLSTVFNENLGPDSHTFFSGTLSGPVTPGPFTISGSPFTYNPTIGNLLLDVRISSSSQTLTPNPTFMAARGPLSGLFSRALDSFIVDPVTLEFVGRLPSTDSIGLVTEFIFK